MMSALKIKTGIRGVSEVHKGLGRANENISKGFEIGVKQAGLKVQRASQKLVPVDTGTLRASAYTRSEGSGLRTNVVIGYTTDYGIYVHEMKKVHPGKKRYHGTKQGRNWDPQNRAQPKFLEQPFREMQGAIQNVIRDSIKKRLKTK